MRFQGSPVSTWPRANSARPKAIAKREHPARSRQPEQHGERAQAAAKNSAMPPGSAVMTKGSSQPWRQGSTRKASAIQ